MIPLIRILLLAFTVDAGDGGPPPSADDLPLACDGGLCDTENGGLCSYPGRPSSGAFGLGLLVAVGAIAAWRRRVVAASLAIAAPASAEPEPAVNVVVKDPPPEHKTFVVDWNPVSFITISKLSADLVIAPGEHHAFVASPYYTWPDTAPVAIFDAAGNARQLPEQKFRGFGAELGYRYYFGAGGPRGLFVGPSFLVGWMQAQAQDKTKTHFADLGLAMDAGYQMILADCVALSLGGGIQGLWTTKDIPAQQWPARIYANRGLGPRLLASVGWAF